MTTTRNCRNCGRYDCGKCEPETGFNFLDKSKMLWSEDKDEADCWKCSADPCGTDACVRYMGQRRD